MFTTKRVSVVEEKRLRHVSFMIERAKVERSLTIKRVSVVEEKGCIHAYSTTQESQIAKKIMLVHRVFLFTAVLSALFFLNALPTVVRSEEESQTTSPNIVTETPVSHVSNIQQESETYLETVYQTEGIPGGDAIVGDFVVGPGKIDVTIGKGTSKTVLMNVTNRTGERRKFNITVEDAKGSYDTSESLILLGDDRGPYSMREYVSVASKSFILDQNERARVPVTITIPENAEPGGLYGSVLIDTVAIEAVPGDTGGTEPQSAIVARIGTLFFITIPGAVEKDGNLVDFSTVPKKSFFQTSPITFGFLFENRGSIHLAPYGELRITNIFGEEVGFLELDPWFVLPESLRLREASWTREFLFGKYTATAYINRSYDDTIDEKSYTFWVLPWKPIMIAFVAIFFVLFVIRTFLKKFEFRRK